MKIRKVFLIAAMLFGFSLPGCNLIPSDSSLSESFGYRVSFESDCPILVPDQMVKEGGKVKEPEIDRPGYVLEGWYCDGVKWDFDKDVVNEDTILVAKWIGKEYKIHFVDEMGPACYDMIVTFGGRYYLPNQRVTGYTFLGWWRDDEQITQTGEWTIPEDVTLTARYEINTYKITLDADGGTLPSQDNFVNVTWGMSYTLPVPTSTFGTFKGWYYGDTKITDTNGNSLEPFTFTREFKAVANWDTEVWNLTEFKAIVNNPAGHYLLMTDLDISGEEWMPICDSSTNPFTGRFDGKGHTISGLTITTTRRYCGLFGFTSGTIKNITLTDVDINVSGLTSDSYVGAVVGCIRGTVRGCKVSGSIVTASALSTLDVYVGGICGSEGNGAREVEISGNINNASVSGTRYVGGICGYISHGCSGNRNSGNIHSDIYAGGIVGYLKGVSTSHCINTGNVTSPYYAAGIVGCVDRIVDPNISDCKNEGDIVAGLCGGGIVGDKKSGQIWWCANTGNISSSNDGTSTDYMGGIAGRFDTPDMNECYNRGNVSGLFNVGGIIGDVEGSTSAKISACYSLGTITSASYAGGIVGSSSLCQLSGCYTVITASGTGSFKGTINGTDGAEIDYSTCYYSSSEGCAYLEGNEVPVHYDEDFYLNTLSFNSSRWSFSGNDYPTLKSESSLIRSE